MGFQVSDMRKVAALLKAKGVKVTEVSGWTTRGQSNFDPRAVVCHWTVATRSITPMLVHGRPGIPGPLCNFEVLPGSGGVRLVAAGKANHAGIAQSGFTNSVAFGIEAAGPPIGADEMKVYHALVAAICKVYGFPVNDRVRDHHEIAPQRKIDISRDHDMGEFRRRVSALIARPAAEAGLSGPPRFPGVRKIGMHGTKTGHIAMIQKRLNALGVARPPLSEDGDFGQKTRDAVLAFQKQHNLDPATGVVGPKTFAALFPR
jgi:hypothetical protein